VVTIVVEITARYERRVEIAVDRYLVKNATGKNVEN